MLLLRSCRFYRFAGRSDTKKSAPCPARDCNCSELKMSSSLKKGERRMGGGGIISTAKILQDFFINSSRLNLVNDVALNDYFSHWND